AVVAERDADRAVGAGDDDVALVHDLADGGWELLTGALDLGRTLGGFDLAGVLGRGESDPEGDNQCQSNQRRFHGVLLIPQSSGRFRNAEPPDAQPDVYIVAESVAQLARSGGRDESRRPYRKPPQDLSGPSGHPTRSR